MADIRTFIAVDLPSEIKMDIDRLITDLRQDGSGIRWVKAANLHITLRFLGDIPEESITGLADAIKGNIGICDPFNLTLSTLGGFPNLKRPRVIWVGTDSGSDALMRLAEKVEQACVDSDFGKADKRFSSHLTIGRVKFSRGLEPLISRIAKTEFELSPFEIRDVAIIKSILSPAGPKYTRLSVVSL